MGICEEEESLHSTMKNVVTSDSSTLRLNIFNYEYFKVNKKIINKGFKVKQTLKKTSKCTYIKIKN